MRSVGTKSQISHRDAGLPNTLTIGLHGIVFAADSQRQSGTCLGCLVQGEQHAAGALGTEHPVSTVGVLEFAAHRGDGIAFGCRGLGVQYETQASWIGLQRQTGVISPHSQVVVTVGQYRLQAIEKTAFWNGLEANAIEAVLQLGLESFVAHHNGRVTDLPQCDLRVAGDAVAAECAGVMGQAQLRRMHRLDDPGETQFITLRGHQARLTDLDGDVLHAAVGRELGFVKGSPSATVEGDFNALFCTRVVAKDVELGVGGDAIVLSVVVGSGVLVQGHIQAGCAQLSRTQTVSG